MSENVHEMFLQVGASTKVLYSAFTDPKFIDEARDVIDLYSDKLSLRMNSGMASGDLWESAFTPFTSNSSFLMVLSVD